MSRVLFSGIAIVLIAAAVILLYNSYLAPRGPMSHPTDLTGAGNPPIAEPPVVPPPAPVTPPAPAPVPVPPVVQAPPPVAPPEPPRAQVVEVPRAKRTHVVQAGETLSSISRQCYGTTEYYGTLARANGLRNKDMIRVGQVLVLPDLPVVVVHEKHVAVETPKGADADIMQPETEEPDDNSNTATRKTDDFVPMPPMLNIAVPKE